VYICICNGITENQVRDAVFKHGAKRVGHVTKQLGACNQCGKCVSATQQVIDECLDSGRENPTGISAQATPLLQYG